ncbi:MAG TPA: VTT domain-containing protein [Planctomycetota bacterium]|nr:VTT domain-containing protein [Planctomycetota bacterium]
MMQQLLEWILAGGYVLMTLVIFVETGLLIGFFLPGDSLLFTAGLACVPGNQLTETLNIPHFDLLTLNLCLIPAAIIGDTVGYWIGYKAGQSLYERERTLFFRKDHLLYTKAFYEKHGGKTIFMARFVPMIRTFAPVVAGIAQMPYKRFFAWNVFGGVFWISSLSILGYFLGANEFVRKNLEATILLIIFISILPMIITFVKAKYFDEPLTTPAE